MSIADNVQAAVNAERAKLGDFVDNGGIAGAIVGKPTVELDHKFMLPSASDAWAWASENPVPAALGVIGVALIVRKLVR